MTALPVGSYGSYGKGFPCPETRPRTCERVVERARRLEERARSKNRFAYRIKQLKECVRTAKSKLRAAKDVIGKMREFISPKQWQYLRPIAPALTKYIERIASFYAKEREGNLKQIVPPYHVGTGRK